MKSLSLYAQSLLYILAGLNHFIRPQIYTLIMPPYIPGHRLMVTLSGIAEIVLGVGLLIPFTRSLAAWGLIVLLLAVFPANVYMVTGDQFANIPAWIRWGRLPLQGLLIWWAYRFT